MKKITAILLSVLMIIGCVSMVAVNAAETTAKITVGGAEYEAAAGDSVTYTVSLTNTNKVVNGQFYINYPQSVLTVSEIKFPIVTDAMSNYDNGTISFNFSHINDNGYDFSKGGNLIVVTFKVAAAGSGTISLEKEVLSSVDSENILISELSNASFSESFAKYVPPVTSITVKAAKTTIYVGGTTTVTANVNNPVGTTKFTSSNTSIATVNATSGKVTAKKAGTVTIKATNNGVSKSVQIKVVKKANTLKVTGKTVTAKAAKNTTIARAKAITVSKAQGTVTYTKKSGDKKITINKKTGKITVKKGLKKGKTYTVKITVKAAGGTTYNAASKVATVKVKVK